MATLHLVAVNTPDGDGDLSRCLGSVRPGDAVLLLGFDVVGQASQLPAIPPGIAFYVLVEQGRRSTAMTGTACAYRFIDYDAFVELTVEYPLTVTWG